MQKLDVRKILVPTDFSETADKAITHASTLARLCNADITLIHVVSSFTFKANLPEVEEDLGQKDRISAAAKKKMEMIGQEIANAHGLKVDVKVASGRTREEVVKAADEIDADLIVMGTHGVSGIKEFLIGSNAFRVVSEANCPVITVQNAAKSPHYKNIVVPIDSSFHSREKLGISVKLAHTYDATLHIAGLRSYDHDDENLNARFRMKLKQVEDYLIERDVKYSMKTIFCSNIAKATMDYGKELDADLLVIMTEQEINTTGFFMGPYAQQVVNHSVIPVLSIKPTEGNVIGITPY